MKMPTLITTTALQSLRQAGRCALAVAAVIVHQGISTTLTFVDFILIANYKTKLRSPAYQTISHAAVDNMYAFG